MNRKEFLKKMGLAALFAPKVIETVKTVEINKLPEIPIVKSPSQIIQASGFLNISGRYITGNCNPRTWGYNSKYRNGDSL